MARGSGRRPASKRFLAALAKARQAPKPEPTPADPEALKPCPFCGSSDLEILDLTDHDGDHDVVECNICGANGPVTNPDTPKEKREAEAIGIWNTRSGAAR